MRKSRICVLLAVFVLLTLAACGKKNQQTEATPLPSPAVSTAAQSPSPSAAPTPALTPRPTRTPAPEATPMPLATAAPADGQNTPADAQATPAAMAAARANAPVITKQPHGEAHYIGESAVFIAAATNWNSLSWTAVSPSGREIDIKTFRETFPDCSVLGESETTLTVTNLSIDMSGWSFCCTFENENAKTKTEGARLRVRDPDNPTGTTTGSTGSATAVATKSKRLRCPGCGSEVPRDLLNCPYCGAGIYTANKDAYVEQDSNGDIYYMDPTGIMYFDSSDRTSTYMDTNTNYAIFNDAGAVQFGNYNKEQAEAEEQAQLMALLGDLGY